jgi:hypothetical protein
MRSGSRRLSACRICGPSKRLRVKEADRKRFGGESWMPPPLASRLNFDRSNRPLTGPKTAADHLPVGFRVTDRASLAGNVSLSSSSSRWSAQCQSALSGVGFVAEALFRAAALSEACVRFPEVLISKSMLVQLGGWDGNLPPPQSFQLNGSLLLRVSSPAAAIRPASPRRRWRWRASSCWALPHSSWCSRRMPPCSAWAPRSSSDRCWCRRTP